MATDYQARRDRLRAETAELDRLARAIEAEAAPYDDPLVVEVRERLEALHTETLAFETEMLDRQAVLSEWLIEDEADDA